LKVFIANRGEIAVRLLRGFQDLGIPTVLGCTQSDLHTLAAKMAEATFLVPSYVNRDAILEGVQQTGATWVHPGIGFFSEDPSFADLLERKGIGWVGPSAACLRLLGDKRATKALARSLGVPVLRDGTLEEEPPSFPVFVKKKEGGGGQGMKCFHEASSFRQWLQLTREPEAFFWEEALLGAHHIEMQCVSTQAGIQVLGDRDCSIQRRHQKIWEEGPAGLLSQGLRESCEGHARRLLEAAGLKGVGTVEYLVCGEVAVLLEVNPRLQVEHGVTECARGIDLVTLQWQAIQGTLANIPPLQNGSAIEVRLLAENPKEAWLPSQGVVTKLEWPAGPGVRVCAGIQVGTEVSPHYDSLLAKIIAFGMDRAEALKRLKRALREVVVSGVTTNLEWLKVLAEQKDLAKGPVDCSWLEGKDFDYPSSTPAIPKDIWKKQNPRVEQVEQAYLSRYKKKALPQNLQAPMPGNVRQLLVSVGDAVRQDQVLVILEAMKMEIELRAPFSGIVESIGVEEGGHCSQGQTCVEVRPEGLDFAKSSV
jgi:acetyl/propionyl-CoA carboxylase alpha subunit